MDAEALAGSHWTEIDHVFGEAFPGPFEDRPTVSIFVTTIADRVGAETFAGDEFALAIAVDIDPLQIVILATERIDLVFGPRALSIGIDLMRPLNRSRDLRRG